MYREGTKPNDHFGSDIEVTRKIHRTITRKQACTISHYERPNGGLGDDVSVWLTLYHVVLGCVMSLCVGLCRVVSRSVDELCVVLLCCGIY